MLAGWTSLSPSNEHLKASPFAHGDNPLPAPTHPRFILIPGLTPPTPWFLYAPPPAKPTHETVAAADRVHVWARERCLGFDPSTVRGSSLSQAPGGAAVTSK